MTDAAIIRQAETRPDAVAVINNGHAIPYADVARGIVQCAQALHGLGLRHGHAMAVECRDPYLHLLLLLAGERLGIVTASFIAGELAAPLPLPLLGQVDLVITEQPAQARGARRVLAITKVWLDRFFAFSGPGPTPAPKKPDDPLRIQRTSGTTGVPKRMIQRRSLHERRLASWTSVVEPGPGQRILLASPFTIASMHQQASTGLRTGATLVFENRIGLGEALVLHGITRATLLPVQLRELLDRLPAHLGKPFALILTTIGGPVAATVRRRALDRVATRLREVYSGNEAGNITIREAEDDRPGGVLLPGVQVEILDDAGRAVPHGESGLIRVRTPYMIDSYLDDPETTARMFKDGWFHPGDKGVFHAGRAGEPPRLEVMGREDEILNIGGVKMLPADIEEHMRAHLPLRDVAVCALPNADGVDEVWMAAVSDAPDDRAIRDRLGQAVRNFPLGPIHIARLAAIPRTETGKIKRAELKRAVAEAAKAR